MTARSWFVGDREFGSRQAALDAIGGRPALLTEVTSGSAMTVSVCTETCPDCGASYQVLGVMGALEIMAEGRPCGCGSTP